MDYGRRRREWYCIAMRSTARRRLTTLFLVLSVLASGLSCSHKRKHDPLHVLSPSYQPLRRDFEEAAGKVRLVVVAAPTCGKCIAATMDEIHDRILRRIQSEDLAVFVIWTSILPTDVESRARLRAERWTDPRGTNYWDDSGQIARCFARMLDLEPGMSAYDCYFIYDRDATWDPAGTMESEPKDWKAFKEGWKPGPAVYRMTQRSEIRLPSFNWNKLDQKLESMLGPEGESGK